MGSNSIVQEWIKTTELLAIFSITREETFQVLFEAATTDLPTFTLTALHSRNKVDLVLLASEDASGFSLSSADLFSIFFSKILSEKLSVCQYADPRQIHT